jgi:glycosyltransferase involved in cell wall biosynthesis
MIASTNRIMLVTNEIQDAPVGGRQQLCKLNHDALKSIFGERLVLVELPRRRLRGLRQLANAFKGHIDGLNAAAIARVTHAIRTRDVHKVFVDGSNLGGIVRIVKQEFPEVEVTTFFHNVEARFFLGLLRHSKTPRAFAMLVANYLAERKAVAFSDKTVCLSERDSRLLRRIYGRAATHVSAIAVHDKMPAGIASHDAAPAGKFALFVGGAFYANRAGICWFAKHVASRIGIKVCVVGRGMDDLGRLLEPRANVAVVGAVESLAEWYRGAHFVIAPIFDGSGMKTKVAEALMFGKKVVGTPEAFSGYASVAERAGWVCTTADEFVTAIEHAVSTIVEPFDPGLRALYDGEYSYPAARSRLARILGEESARHAPVDMRFRDPE